MSCPINWVAAGSHSGLFKILIDGGTLLSAVEVLHLVGQSATALHLAYDGASNSRSRVASVARANVRNLRLASMPKQVLGDLVKQDGALSCCNAFDDSSPPRFQIKPIRFTSLRNAGSSRISANPGFTARFST